MAKIVIADDDPFLIQIYSTRFSRDGHEVLATTDGQSALDKIKETKPDLVILDIMLPKLSGLDVLSAIKEDRQLSKIPVVILSNLSHAEEQEEAKKRGATEFLAKVQYTPSQVVQALQKYLPKTTSKTSIPQEEDSKDTKPKSKNNHQKK